MKRLLFLLSSAIILVQCTPSSTDESVNDTSTVNNDQNNAVTLSGQEAVQDDESAKNILQVAAASPDHTTLAAAVQAAGLTTVLANNGPLTVFAPTNAAFDALPEGTVAELLKPENKSKLAEIITFHAAPGTYDVPALKDGQSLFVATGHNIKVEIKDDGTYVHGAKILGTVPATNGIVHVVDQVLLPQ